MAKKGNNRKDGSPAWAWLVTGLLVGLFVAFLVYLQNQQSGEQSPQADSRNRDARSVRPQEEKEIPPPPKPRFDFYTILPEMEIPVPDEGEEDNADSGGHTDSRNDETEKDTPTRDKPKLSPGETYVLQVGAFRQYEEADRFKARLALLGFESHIQTVEIDGTNWHRVRIGPYSDVDRVREIQQKLKQNAIDVLLLKMKG